MEMRERLERRVEERPNLDEEELRLREQTLSRTPSESGLSKSESGIFAPQGGGQGMVPISSERTSDVGEKTEETAKRIRSSDLGGR